MSSDFDSIGDPPPDLDNSQAGTERLSSSELVRASVYGFKEKDMHLFSGDVLEHLRRATRVSGSVPFWSSFSIHLDAVADLSGGVGTESAVVSRFVRKVVAWDPDPNKRAISQNNPYLFSMSSTFPILKRTDAVVVDPWWGNHYDHSTQTLDLSDMKWVLQVFDRASPFDPGFVVMKTPKFVKCNWLRRAFQVRSKRSNTGYLVHSLKLTAKELKGIYESFDPDVFDVQVLHKETRIVMGLEKDPLAVPGFDPFEGLVKREFRERDIEDVESGKGYIIPRELPLKKGNDVNSGEAYPNVQFVDASGPRGDVDNIDSIISTGFADDIEFQKLWEWIKTIWNTVKESFYVKSFVSELQNRLDKKVFDEFPDGLAPADFKKEPVIFSLGGATQASGFMHNGALITAYHASKGENIVFKGITLSCKGFDVERDIAWYGSDFTGFVKTKENRTVYACTAHKRLKGIVVSVSPLQVRFNGAPVPGLSGSPLFDENKNVVGIYANHSLGVGTYLTLSTRTVWVSEIGKKLDEEHRINAYVPCGQGKSTYLVKSLVDRGRKPLVIVPRAALPKEVAKRVGPFARGFSGDEKIDEQGCKALFITHGKFLNAVASSPTRFAAYDTLMVDEAHDLTALTRATIEWASQKWDKDLVLMTGSPNGVKFGNLASKQTKFDVEDHVLPHTVGLDPKQMMIHLRANCKQGAHLIQVPSSSYAKKCMDMCTNKKTVLLSRAEIDKHGFDHFTSLIRESPQIWIFATPVVNIGFTLEVDSITIQGNAINNEAPMKQASSLDTRFLTHAELYQWLGRVGRVRKGKRYVPNIPWSTPRMASSELHLLESWRVVLDLDGDSKVGGKTVTKAQASTLVKLPFSVSQGLGMTDEDGVISVTSEVNKVNLSSEGLPVKVGTYEKTAFALENEVITGPATGLDTRAKEFNKNEATSVETGLISSALISAAIYWAVKTFMKWDLQVVGSYEVGEQRTTKGPGVKDSFKKEPGIMVKKLDVGVDDTDPLYDTISTSGSLLDLILPTFFRSSWNGVSVRHSYSQRIVGQAMAYYLSSKGVVGEKIIGENLPVPSEEDCEDGCLSDDFLDELDAKIDESVVVTTSLATAFLGGLFGGLPVVLLIIAGTWLTYGLVPGSLKGLQGFMQRNSDSFDKKLFSTSPIGSVVKTSIFALHGFFSPVVAIFGVFMIPKKVSVPVKLGPLSFPLEVETSLPSWIYKAGSYVMQGVSGSLVWEVLKSSPVILDKTLVWSTLKQSTLSRIGAALGFFSEPLLFGMPYSAFLKFSVTMVLGYITAFGPEFPNWTLVYPLSFLMILIYGFAKDIFFSEMAFLLLLIFFVRLQYSDMRIMMGKGSFQGFTSADEDVSIVGNAMQISTELGNKLGLTFEKVFGPVGQGKSQVQKTVKTSGRPEDVPIIEPWSVRERFYAVAGYDRRRAQLFAGIMLALSVAFRWCSTPFFSTPWAVLIGLALFTIQSDNKMLFHLFHWCVGFPARTTALSVACFLLGKSIMPAGEEPRWVKKFAAFIAYLVKFDVVGVCLSVVAHTLTGTRVVLLGLGAVYFLLSGRPGPLLLAMSFDETDEAMRSRIISKFTSPFGLPADISVFMEWAKRSGVFQWVPIPVFWRQRSSDSDPLPTLSTFLSALNSYAVRLFGRLCSLFSFEVLKHNEESCAADSKQEMSDASEKESVDTDSGTEEMIPEDLTPESTPLFEGMKASSPTDRVPTDEDLETVEVDLLSTSFETLFSMVNRYVSILISSIPFATAALVPDFTPYNILYTIVTLLVVIILLLVLVLMRLFIVPIMARISPYVRITPRSSEDSSVAEAAVETSGPDFRSGAVSPRARRALKDVARILSRTNWEVLAKAARKTKWVKMFGLSMIIVPFASLMHPYLGILSLCNVSIQVLSLLAFAHRFDSRQDPVFSKDILKLVKHTVFDARSMRECDPIYEVGRTPRPLTKKCVVIGVAGSYKWLEKALGLYLRMKSEDAELSGLFIVDKQIGDMLRELPDVPDLLYHVVNIGEPSEIRSARMLPMFDGYEDVYYLHRDADWNVTPLEREATKLRINLTCNPIGMSPGPVLLASMNYWGGAFKNHRRKWERTQPYWKTYGHDERIANSFQLNYVYNRLTPNEETLLMCSAAPAKVPEGRVIVPRIFLSNNEMKEVSKWRAHPVSSYGDDKWRTALHRINSSPRTYCGSAHVEIINTSWSVFSFGALIAMLYTAAVSLLLEPTFFSIGKKEYFDDSARTSSFPLSCAFFGGSLVGIFVGVPCAAKQIRSAKRILAEDNRFRGDYQQWNAARAVRHLASLLRLRTETTCLSIIAWMSALSNPFGFFLSAAIHFIAPFLKERPLMVACAFAVSGLKASLIPVLFLVLGAFGLPGMEETGIGLAGVVSIVSTNIPYWSHYPFMGVRGVLNMPYLGLEDSQVIARIKPGHRTGHFVCGWVRDKWLHVQLPDGMINTRCATAIYLSRKSFVNFRQYDEILVVGAGKGGFAQGILHERFQGRLTLITLDEHGFTPMPTVRKENVTVLLMDVFDYDSSHDLVVCDVSKSCTDEIWWKDEFEHEEVRAEEEETIMAKSVRLVRLGGDMIVTCGVLWDHTLYTYLSFLALHFKEVCVVDEPIKNDCGHHFIVCRKKLNRQDPIILNRKPNDFEALTVENVDNAIEFTSAIGRTIGLFPQDSTWNHYWTGELMKIFNSGTSAEQADMTMRFSLGEALLSQDSLDFIESKPLSYTNNFFDQRRRDEFVTTRSIESKAFVVHGKTTEPPVQDREFNAGIDLISQNLLRQVDVLPLKRIYDVPSQSNMMVREGLIKRYNFEEQMPPGTMYPVIDALMLYHLAQALDYDFSKPDWDELRTNLTKQSSCGYMSPVGAKNVVDMVDNYRDHLEDTMEKVINGGSLNLTFHASPKIEKKEVADLREEAVPRLFLYREGAVRLCTVRLAKRFNDFMADREKWFSSCCGDIFYRAGLIVGLYKKYRKPRGLVFEASKWDGHVPGELYVQMRKGIITMLKENPSADEFSRYLHSMTEHDVFGSLYMCDGTFVEFLRGNKKSGESDTSWGNKVKNDIIEIDLVSRALDISPIQSMRRVDRVTEGDDKEVVGEEEDIVKIASLRNEVYDLYGIPQKGEAVVIECPERSSFCSHGYTELSNGICVPIRDLHEVFGRLLVPTANGQFTLDFAMASRCLTSVISLVATFWYLPEVRRFYEVVREVIPKDVIAADIDRQERWKFYYNLGILNPTKFELSVFLKDRFGRTGLDGMLNKEAEDVLNIKDFRSLRYLSAPYAIKELRTMMTDVSESYEVSLWYEDLVSPNAVMKDLKYFKEREIPVQFFSAKPSQVRAVYLGGGETMGSSSYGTFLTIMGRVKASVLHLIFSRSMGSQLSWAKGILNRSRVMYSGFRGKKVVIGSVDEGGDFQTEKVITTSSSFFPLALVVIGILFSILAIRRFDRTVSTNSFISRGTEIRSPSSTIVSNVGPIRKRLSQIKGQPYAQVSHELSRVLAYLNVSDKPMLSGAKRVASQTATLLSKTSRRFGALVYDDYGMLHSYLFYNEQADARMGHVFSQKDRRTACELLGIPLNSSLQPYKWRANGSMITVTDWRGSYSYGQLERPMPFFESLQQELRSVVLFVRISDCPCLRFDGKDANSYIFPKTSAGRLTKYGLVIGESTSGDHVDICKPYDADLLADLDSPVLTPWGSKDDQAVFRGGSTGSGSTPQTNVRWYLVMNERSIEGESGVRCDFKFTSVRRRLSVDVNGDFNYVDNHETVGKQSYLEMGSNKFLVCPEGNEAPDRVLNCMMTGSLVLYLDAEYCQGTKGWMDPFLLHRVNCIRCSVQDLAKHLAWAISNDSECSRIAKNGHLMATYFLQPEHRRSFMLNSIAFSVQTGEKSHVRNVISWHKVNRGHSVMFVDKDHNFGLGSVINVDSSYFTYSRVIGKSVGSGVSVYWISTADALMFSLRARNLPVSRLRSSSALLSASEIGRLRDLTSPDKDSERLIKSMGTLGDGNDFVELVGYQSKLCLLIHAGSREFSNLYFPTTVNPENHIGLEESVRFVREGNEVSSLNRRAIARHFHAGELMGEWSHSEIIEPRDALTYGLPEGTYWTSKMVRGGKGVLVLGSPGNGAAILTSGAELVPHGTGGKGSRFRPLKNISRERMLYGLLHHSLVPTFGFDEAPTGGQGNQDLEVEDDSSTTWSYSAIVI